MAVLKYIYGLEKIAAFSSFSMHVWFISFVALVHCFCLGRGELNYSYENKRKYDRLGNYALVMELIREQRNIKIVVMAHDEVNNE